MISAILILAVAVYQQILSSTEQCFIRLRKPNIHVLILGTRVAAPRTSAQLKDKFLSHCSQISAGDHMQIIGDPITVVEEKVLTS